MRILAVVEAHDKWFVQRRDSVGRLGHSALVKVTAAHRMLAYGCPADALDESLRIGESTTIQSVRRYARAIVEVFGPQYLRPPTPADTQRLLAVGAQRGFPE